MARKFCVLLLLAACVLSGQSALLGSKKCTYGPSYWCSSLRGAKECNAVQHCIQTVWEKQKLPEDNDDICTLCKNMVQEARDQLLSNETQEEIRMVFEGSCRLIPIRLVSDECVHLADEFIPELIDTLASQMNPQVVCATAGLCNNVEVDMLLREYKKAHPVHENAIAPAQAAVPPQQPHTPQPGDCEACKDFVSRTIRLVKTHSRAELLDRLLAICGRLGSLSDGCMALVESNFNDIYIFLTQKLTPEDFCNLVEMCEARMHDGGFYQRAPLPRTGDEACDFCEAIVQHWREILTSNTTEQEFKQILDGLCRQTGSFSKNCLALVDEYFLPLYNLLVSEIHPKQICEVVGLCGLDSVFAKQPPVWTLLNAQQQEEVVPQVRLIPAIPVQHEPGQRMTGQDEAAAISLDHQDQPHLAHVPLAKSGIAVSHIGRNGVVGPAVRDNNKCVMCEFVMQFLRNMLQQNDTRKDIEDAVEKVCSLLPHTLTEECDDYVEAYGDQVIELLAQEIDPEQVCKMLHLCPANPKALAVKEDMTCELCEFAMTQLEDILAKPKTEENIREALDHLCSVLPRTLTTKCQLFVDTYAEQVINMIIHDFTPDQICIQLCLCYAFKAPQLQELSSSNQLPVSRMFVNVPAPVETTISPPSTELEQSTMCVLCEFAMDRVDHFLEENATKSEIITVVDFMCAHLPKTLSGDCLTYVDMYGDAIIEALVENELSPKKVCQKLMLCKPPKFTGPRATRKLNKCQICEAVVTQVDNELENQDTEHLIDSLLEKVCRYLPFNISDQCRDMVEVYGPFLVNMLAEVLVPKKVCEELHLCPKTSQESLLGGQKCSWGPAYWCQTQIHAAACNAVTHCQQTVWRMHTPLI